MNNLEFLVNRHHEEISASEQPRAYLGCSIAGQACQRKLWLMYRWAFRENFDGRTLRAFRRGHQEERNAIADLQGAGCRITGRQREVDLAPGIKGHIDGVITNVPGHAGEKFLLEIKSLNRERFRLVETKGVQNGLPEHWLQIQLYLLGTGLQYALYYAICKDDERIYTQIISADRPFATRAIARLSALIADDRIPPPISTDPTWWQCRGCPAYSFCHHKNAVTLKNCRTCRHAQREEDGSWTCHIERLISGPPVLSEEVQRMGCHRHELHPDLKPQR